MVPFESETSSPHEFFVEPEGVGVFQQGALLVLVKTVRALSLDIQPELDFGPRHRSQLLDNGLCDLAHIVDRPGC